jgi:lactoylglutathione lyase
MLRVVDLDAALNFYRDALGMRLLRRHDYSDVRFTRAFVGYGEESDEAAIELTHNWDTSEYSLGNAYGHVAVEVNDAAETCARALAFGYKITRQAGPMKHEKTVIAFIEDPDGYKIELIQKEKIAQNAYLT